MKTRSGRPPSQRPDELAAFIDLLRAEGVRRYLEVGARDGDTFHEVMMALPAGSTGVAVDAPGGKWGRADSEGNLRAAIKALRGEGRSAAVVWGDSQTLATRQSVMVEGPYDAVLIDGDHTYEGVRADWENYGHMARIVAFHDIDGTGMQTKAGDLVEVPRLWAEIKASGAKCHEIIGEVRGMGIGVVFR